MEMSVREARAQFAHALAAAEQGERVTITKNGKPVAELGPPSPLKGKPKWTWEDLDRIQEELGIESPSVPLDDEWLMEFNDPAAWPEVFGPEYR